MHRQLKLSGEKENGTYTLGAWTSLPDGSMPAAQEKTKSRCSLPESRKLKLAAVGFEPTPPKRLVP